MLEIKTTGLQDYLDGSANIKSLIVGGPGVGKTRSASYWPKPIYLDCENSRGSLVDRQMPYADIRSSKDMLDALDFLKNNERTPKAERPHQTVVVDTLDSFQRIVKDEWMRDTKADKFSGFDAWGYLDAKMQMLTTRLLNLDYNVVVLVHFKEKSNYKDDDRPREFELQLQGAVAYQLFNDFGLVGWLDWEWASDATKGKYQKRRLTFRPSVDKPFLKDRFNAIKQEFLPITFSDEDYNQLFRAFFDNPEFEAMKESAVVGQIPDAEVTAIARSVQPPTEGGPVGRAAEPQTREGGEAAESAPPAVDPSSREDKPLHKHTVPELTEIAKGLDIQLRGNLLKSELIGKIEEKRMADRHAAESKPASESSPEPEAAKTEPETPAQEEKMAVNTRTGEILSPEELVKQELGGETIEVIETAPPETPTPAPVNSEQGRLIVNCDKCGADLAEDMADPEKRNYVRLGKYKFKRDLCASCARSM